MVNKVSLSLMLKRFENNQKVFKELPSFNHFAATIE